MFKPKMKKGKMIFKIKSISDSGEDLITGLKGKELDYVSLFIDNAGDSPYAPMQPPDFIDVDARPCHSSATCCQSVDLRAANRGQEDRDQGRDVNDGVRGSLNAEMQGDQQLSEKTVLDMFVAEARDEQQVGNIEMQVGNIEMSAHCPTPGDSVSDTLIGQMNPDSVNCDRLTPSSASLNSLG